MSYCEGCALTHQLRDSVSVATKELDAKDAEIATLRAALAQQEDLSRAWDRVRALEETVDRARRETASDPDNRWCRNATIILNAALAPAPTPGDAHDGGGR